MFPEICLFSGLYCRVERPEHLCQLKAILIYDLQLTETWPRDHLVSSSDDVRTAVLDDTGVCFPTGLQHEGRRCLITSPSWWLTFNPWPHPASLVGPSETPTLGINSANDPGTISSSALGPTLGCENVCQGLTSVKGTAS